MEAMCVRIIMYRGLKTTWLRAQKFIPQVNWNFIQGATMENPKIFQTDQKPSALNSQALLAHLYMDQYKR